MLLETNYFELYKPKGLSSKIAKNAPYSTLSWYNHCRDFTWDQNQRLIIRTFADTKRNLIINAVAGAGKTRMLQALPLLVPPKANGRQIAFNKAIADELASSGRLMSKFAVSTFHSLGFGMLRQHNNGLAIRVDGNKVSRLINSWFDTKVAHWSVHKVYYEQKGQHYLWLMDALIKDEPMLSGKQMIESIVRPEFSWLRNTLLDKEDVQINLIEALEDALGNHAIGEHITDYLNICEQLIEYLKNASLSMALGEHAVVDFDDMIYLPHALGLSPSYKDVVFIDGCQDLNNAQLDMVRKMVNAQCRIVAVGDPRQAIYGFRGANPQSWQTLIEMINPLELDMTYTYRCCQAVTRMAATLNPKIVSPDFAIQGEVKGIESKGLAHFVKEGDLVLCRTNGPLFAWFFSCVSLGTKVKLLGRDIVDRLFKHLKGDNALKIDAQWLARLKASIEEKMTKAIEKQKPGRVMALKDDLYCLTLCYENLGANTLGELRNKINEMVVDDANESCVRISTVHRAKGLESDRVFLLNYQWLPFNHPDADVEQEINLTYVAVTRAKVTLYLVGENQQQSVGKFPKADSIRHLTQPFNLSTYYVDTGFFIRNAPPEFQKVLVSNQCSGYR